jgi:allantoin racemase
MRILLINPNTMRSMTDLVLETARGFASPGVELTGATGRFGARYITTRAASAIAAHAALDAYAEHGADCDAVILACFGDPGLGGLKELATQPVVGMAEAACLAAASLDRKFAIVTGGERWGPMLEEFVAAMGLADKLACVRTIAPTGADIARDPEGSLKMLSDACNACVTDHGAGSVILGGAGLAGLAARIRDRVPVPLIDGVAAAVKAAETLAALKPAKPASGSYAPTTPVETVGLSAALTRAISPASNQP